MTLDTKARATAQKLLIKFGKNAAYKSIQASAYNPDTGSTANSETIYQVKCYLDQPNRQELAGGQVVTSDEVAIVAAQGFAATPALNDKMLIDGRDRLVKMVGRVWSGEQVALWRIGLAS